MGRSTALAAKVFATLTVGAVAALSAASDARAEEPRARVARAPVPLDGIAAVVEDVIVFRSEVAARVRRFESTLSHDPIKRRAERVEIEKQILGRMIDEILMMKDAKRLQIEVSDADVSAGIDMVAQANNFDRKRLEAEVQKAGYSVVDYYEDVRRQITEQRWLVIRAAGKIDRKKAPDVTIFQALLEKQREALLAELRGHAFIEVR
jgi:hypothetical protein